MFPRNRSNLLDILDDMTVSPFDVFFRPRPRRPLTYVTPIEYNNVRRVEQRSSGNLTYTEEYTYDSKDGEKRTVERRRGDDYVKRTTEGDKESIDTNLDSDKVDTFEKNFDSGKFTRNETTADKLARLEDEVKTLRDRLQDKVD